MKPLTLFMICVCLCSTSHAIMPVQNPIKITDSAAQKTELMLFYTPWCPYSQKVLNYLKQIHKSVPMKNIQNDPAAKEILKNQGGKSQVPCLFIDGKALYESDSIIDWMANHKDQLSDAIE